jgi:AbrB family looped-hinge helix DNA binding protein
MPLQWYGDAMRTTIDAAGRIVVPKRLREELGLGAGTEVELEAIDGRLELTVPSRVRVEQGPHGARFAASGAPAIDAATVRDLVERGRR